MKIKLSDNQYNKWFWIIPITGVPIGYLGMWLDIPFLMWIGIVLAIPLFIIVLPFCLFLILATITQPIWTPFYRMAIRRHGAPFHPGDSVRILRRPHRNEICRIYAVWEERDEVRVELGEKEKKEVTDVFSFLQVRRVPESKKNSFSVKE
jgi:hypothetical protein